MNEIIRVLVDSTYILPAFGIKVIGLGDEVLLKLERLRIRRLVNFFYTDIIWVEIIPKVEKEYRDRNIELTPETFESIIESLYETFTNIAPGLKALREAYRLRMLGHRDMIDNLLYGIAVENNLYLLSQDRVFKEFLRRNNLSYEVLLDHQELFKRVNEVDSSAIH